MLSTEDLALLEAIRETGSLSRAAAYLGKAPSTVSYAARNWRSVSMRCCSTAAATVCN
nr:LysR family transcriptional regulator [Pseudomonas sp. PDM26]